MNFIGLKIVTDERMAKPRWEFPTRRFVEYGPEDESWARAAGYGREVMEPIKAATRIGDTLFMHPKILEALQKAVG